MFQKIGNKLVGWLMCIMTKFSKASNEKQYAIYAAVFVLPVFLGYLCEWNLNIFLFVYYLFAYFFFQIGLGMVRK